MKQVNLTAIANAIKYNIKQYIITQDKSFEDRVLNIMSMFPMNVANFILKSFDRTGYYTEYKTSGIRINNNHLVIIKEGYSSVNEIPDTLSKTDKLVAELYVGKLMESTLMNVNDISFIKTDELVNLLKLVIRLNGLNIHYKDDTSNDIKAKASKITSIINNISCEGPNHKKVNELFNVINHDIFLSLPQTINPEINRFLMNITSTQYQGNVYYFELTSNDTITMKYYDINTHKVYIVNPPFKYNLIHADYNTILQKISLIKTSA